MSEFKGTKGEWAVDDDRSHLELTVATNKKRICEVKSYGIETVYKDLTRTDPTYQECKANAKLIACAPLMLEMLKDILSGMNNENFEITGDEIEQLIKKATT